MELVIGKKSLEQMTGLAQGVVPKRTTKPILMHILLEADSVKGLSISATDEELSFSGTVETQVVQPGSIAVSAKDLHDVVKRFPDKDIHLSVNPEESLLELKSGRIKFGLQTLPAEEFPGLPEINPENSYSFPVEKWSWLSDRTLFAVSQEETRYYLGGVYMECQESMLRGVATDGHRLALAELEAPEGFVLEEGRILPRKLLTELRKMIDKKEGDLQFGFQDKRVIFHHGLLTLSSLLVEGTFPDYRQVVPDNSSISCRVLRKDLFDGLQRISLMSPDKTGGVRFQSEGRQLVISSQQVGRGQGKEEVEIQEGGGEIEAGFNANYFIDAMKVLETEQVLLEFNDHLSPCVLKPFVDDSEDKEEGGQMHHLNVIMPMRL